LNHYVARSCGASSNIGIGEVANVERFEKAPRVSRQGSKCHMKRSCLVRMVNIFMSPGRLVLSNMATSAERAERTDIPLLFLFLLLMLSNMLTSAESAEWISPLLLVLLLLLAEVAAPASPRLQVQETQRGRHTGQGQRQLSRLGDRRPHRASLHLPLGENGDRGRLVRENVPETRTNSLPRFQGTTTVSSMQGSPCACRSRPRPTS